MSNKPVYLLIKRDNIFIVGDSKHAGSLSLGKILSLSRFFTMKNILKNSSEGKTVSSSAPKICQTVKDLLEFFPNTFNGLNVLRCIQLTPLYSSIGGNTFIKNQYQLL